MDGEPAEPTLQGSTLRGPSAPWLAFGFLLAGFGTVMLGPVLPVLAHRWQLQDSQSGLMLMAKFVGAFLGGISVPRSLRKGIALGAAAACVGFGIFAMSNGLLMACGGLLCGGFGLGQIIVCTNLLIGRRYSQHTGSALSLINFFWSLGAVACGLIVAAALPRLGLRDSVLCFSALLLAAGVGGLLRTVGSAAAKGEASVAEAAVQASGLPRAALWQFCGLLFLYGGLETCLSGWITTYTLRFSNLHLLGGQSGLILLWGALTAGRVLAAAAMRRTPEIVVQRVGLVAAAVLVAALFGIRSGAVLSVDCVLLGLALAPFFPSTFALLMVRRPTAREAGLVLAVSGLGAALFPWLMGALSTAAGSLRTAMAVPLALDVALLVLSLQMGRQRSGMRASTGAASV